MKITERLAVKFLQKLCSQPSFGRWHVTHELQDDWKFLLVSVDVEDTSTQGEIVSFLKEAQETAEAVLPWRQGDYSWMINIRKAGQVVESVFGGDLESPRSGRIS